MKLCDLHTHSTFSDGTCTPKQLIDAAVDMGFAAIALCDHNTADGLPDFLAAAESRPVEAIPGIEFSVDYNGTELHLLALYVPEAAYGQITLCMEEINRRKEESNLKLIDSLCKIGIHLDYATIKAATPKGLINRSHIANEMIRLGYVRSKEEAFAGVLDKKAGHYIEPQRLSVWDALELIRDIGAVPVLAHPFLNLTEAELAAFLPMGKKRGLLGMECYYSTYTPDQTRKALALAKALQLLPSGGSDFHGENKPDIRLGTGKGNLAIPYEWAAALRAAR